MMTRLTTLPMRYILPFAAINANAQIEPEMVLVPAACVEVGSLLMDYQTINPLRHICIDSFYIGQFEVTFKEYDQFTLDTGRAARHDLSFGRLDRPVVDVSWFDAVEYADWLSEKTGKRYRLPTDAEWEYVAGINADFGYRYSWGPDPEENRANCRDCGSQWDAQLSAPVGSFEANALGIHDLHGNVWEWTSDCFSHDNEQSEEAAACEVGVVRGGSWNEDATKLVFWSRTAQLRNKPAADVGFRLVRDN